MRLGSVMEPGDRVSPDFERAARLRSVAAFLFRVMVVVCIGSFCRIPPAFATAPADQVGYSGSAIKLTYGGPRDGLVPTLLFSSASIDKRALDELTKANRAGFDYTSDSLGFVDAVQVTQTRLANIARKIQALSLSSGSTGAPGKGRYLSLTLVIPAARGALGSATTKQYFLGLEDWLRVWPILRTEMANDVAMQTALDRFTAASGIVVPAQ